MIIFLFPLSLLLSLSKILYIHVHVLRYSGISKLLHV